MRALCLRTCLVLALTLGLAFSAGVAQPVGAAPAHDSSIVVSIDNPAPGEQNMSPGWIAGWAVDMASTGGTGIDTVAVYLDGDQTTGTLLGMANYGGDRPDVAAALGGEQFRYSGFTMPLTGMDISAGPHTFTVVAHSTATNDFAAKSVSGVTLAPGNTTTTAPATNYNNQPRGLQVSATLSNVSFLAGQNLYNTLPSFNGYIFPGFTMPNGTTLSNGTTLTNGMLTYNGSLVPVQAYVSPTTLPQSTTLPTGSYTYRTVLPNGAVIPSNATTGYYNGNVFTGLQPGVTVAPNVFAPYQGQNDVVLYQPTPNGYMATVTLPSPNTFGPNFSYSNVNLNGNAGVQATLVAKVTFSDGSPVQGATVTYSGYQLPATDSNGITTGTVLFPVTTGQQLSGTVHATFNGMSADVPVVLNYNLP